MIAMQHVRGLHIKKQSYADATNVDMMYRRDCASLVNCPSLFSVEKHALRVCNLLQ